MLRHWLTWGCSALLVAVGLVGGVWAEEPAEKAPEGGPAAETIDIHQQLADKDFDAYVDLAALADAIATGDAGAIAEAARSLAEGEKAVGRAHKGLTSAKLLQAALRAATTSGDPAALDAVAAVAEELKRDDLKALIAAAKATGGGSRAAGPQITIDPTGDLSALMAFRNTLDTLNQAKTFRDRAALDALAEGLDVGPEFDPKLRAYLADQIAAAQKAIPADAKPLDETLLLLAATSRSSSASDDPDSIPFSAPTGTSNAAKIWKYCKLNFGKKVGDGQCAALNSKALYYATGKYRTAADKPNDGDYVWGALQYTLKPGSTANASKLLKGDLLQFRDVRLEGKTSTGTYYKTASHHSAVVMGISTNPTVIHVFHQNVGGVQKVMHGTFRIGDLKKGTIWCYRK